MIYLFILMVLISFLLVFIIKDLLKIIRIASIITIISGYLIIIVGFIIRVFINNRFSIIRISKITDPIFNGSVSRGLMLILVGGIELIVYISIRIYDKYRLVS